mgnify:CR=1 FL=1
MLKRLSLIGALLLIVSGAAQAAMCRSTYTDLRCSINCENQFIICKSVSYDAAVCQNAYNSCMASCIRCSPYISPYLGSVTPAEPTLGEKIFGAQLGKTE